MISTFPQTGFEIYESGVFLEKSKLLVFEIEKRTEIEILRFWGISRKMLSD